MAKDKNKDFELNKLLDQKSEDGMRKTNRWSELWQESLKYFFGEQLRGKTRHKSWDWVVINYIWPSAMQEIAKLSKNHPKILVHPWEESDTEYAEAWQSKLQWDWQRGINGTGMRLEQIAAIMDGKLYGYRVGKVYWEDQCHWDDEQKQWVGDVKFRLWHPGHFWASDEEKVDDGDCGTVRYVPLEWAIRRWPDFEDELRQEAVRFKGEDLRGEKPVRGSQSGTGSAAAIAAGLYSGGSDKYGGGLPANMLIPLILGTEENWKPEKAEIVKIEEFYLKDYSTTHRIIEEDIPKEELLATGQMFVREGIYYDKNNDEPVTLNQWPKRVVRKYDEPDYPHGRFIIRCGNTILNPKKQEQVYPYTKWPFVIVPHYLLPHMWRGVNAVELYKSAQDMLNISVSHLFNNMKMFGDPKVAVETDAIATDPRTKKHYKISSMAGAVIRLARGGLAKFKIIDPMPPSAGTLMLYKLFAQEFKNLTGLQGIARGEKESGRMTATEAQQLALTSHDRIALQSAYEEEWIKGIVERVGEITQKNYDAGRFARIIGEDNIVGIMQITGRHKSLKFDVEIEIGSQLPFDAEKRQARYVQAYQLFADPNPNPMMPELLRILEIGNIKKLLQQHQPWILWKRFLGLYEAVRAGQVAPQQATQIILAETVRIALEGRQGGMGTRLGEAQNVGANKANIPQGGLKATQR